jgi:3-methyladenine DNA glycosylase AlkC
MTRRMTSTRAEIADPTAFRHALGPSAVAKLAEALAAVAGPSPETDAFQRAALTGLDPLPLKARVAHITSALCAMFARAGWPFERVAEALQQAGRDWRHGGAWAPEAGFPVWPLFEVVPRLGLDHLALSLETLRQLTPLFTAEFSIRPLLARHGDAALRLMAPWAHDADAHVRRLLSEGTRTRLPWASRVAYLSAAPDRVLPLLAPLIADPSAYVRTSVANHLNDVSKDAPARALDVAAAWLSAPLDPERARDEDRRWVVKHALRGLIKAGDPRALALLGHHGAAPRSVTLRLSPERVPWAGALTLRTVLEAAEGGSWVVDWALCLPGARDTASPSRRKVLKLKTLRVEAGERVTLERMFSFAPVTTRFYYPGPCAVELVVNGAVVARTPFVLDAPA